LSIYIALLRAVNVGGTGKMPMADLKILCEDAGFVNVRTYIASGNVVFKTALSAAQTKAALEAKLAVYAGKVIDVMVRTVPEMEAVLAANPFSNVAPNRVVAIFLDTAPPADALMKATGKNAEECVLGLREIYVHYGDGMADSKLKIPAAATGTARNMNTIVKVIALAQQLEN
jgi:uncharacterized protein (DUF1697 family)